MDKEYYVAEDVVFPVTKKTIVPDNSLSHLRAVEFDTRVKNSKDTNNLNDLLRDVEESKVEDYKEWLEKEEKVLDDMSDKEIAKAISRLNLKKKINKIMLYFKIPLTLKYEKEIKIFDEYMREYMLRLHAPFMFFKSASCDPIQYDLYRGMKIEKFQLNMDTYVEIRDENLRKEEKPKVWYKKTLSKFF
jgi:hypothetical protein